MDESVDVVLSNCVIVTVSNKKRVFTEVFRVLKPGGRIAISDIVSVGRLPKKLREDPQMWAHCIGGAIPKNQYLKLMEDSGFRNVNILSEREINFRGEKIYSIGIKAFKLERTDRADDD